MFIAMILADADDTIYDGMCVVRKHILLLCIQYLKRIEHLFVRTKQCKSAHNSSIAAEVVRYFDRIYHI